MNLVRPTDLLDLHASIGNSSDCLIHREQATFFIYVMTTVSISKKIEDHTENFNKPDLF